MKRHGDRSRLHFVPGINGHWTACGRRTHLIAAPTTDDVARWRTAQNRGLTCKLCERYVTAHGLTEKETSS